MLQWYWFGFGVLISLAGLLGWLVIADRKYKRGIQDISYITENLEAPIVPRPIVPRVETAPETLKFIAPETLKLIMDCKLPDIAEINRCEKEKSLVDDQIIVDNALFKVDEFYEKGYRTYKKEFVNSDEEENISSGVYNRKLQLEDK